MAKCAYGDFVVDFSTSERVDLWTADVSQWLVK